MEQPTRPALVAMVRRWRATVRRSARHRRSVFSSVCVGVVLLWALAYEVDALVGSVDDSLASIVEHLSSQRSPVVTDWPETWAVDVDAMEANGWEETLLPSSLARPKTTPCEGHVVQHATNPCDEISLCPPQRCRLVPAPAPAWVCRWWQAFREWTTVGSPPQVDVLAALLAERTAALPESPLYARDLHEYRAAFDDRVDAMSWFWHAARDERLILRRGSDVRIFAGDRDIVAYVSADVYEGEDIRLRIDAQNGLITRARVLQEVAQGLERRAVSIRWSGASSVGSIPAMLCSWEWSHYPPGLDLHFQPAREVSTNLLDYERLSR